MLKTCFLSAVLVFILSLDKTVSYGAEFFPSIRLPVPVEMSYEVSKLDDDLNDIIIRQETKLSDYNLTGINCEKDQYIEFLMENSISRISVFISRGSKVWEFRKNSAYRPLEINRAVEQVPNNDLAHFKFSRVILTEMNLVFTPVRKINLVDYTNANEEGFLSYTINLPITPDKFKLMHKSCHKETKPMELLKSLDEPID